MTDEERQELKDELMKAGFWDDAGGDPTAEDAAATALYYELECQLREGVYLNFAYDHDAQHQELCVRRGDFVYALPKGEDRNEAICLAAQLLPVFCAQCGHRADVPRTICDCGECLDLRGLAEASRADADVLTHGATAGA